MNNKKFWISLLAGLMAAVMILSLLLSLIPVNANAATSGEIKDQIEEMEKEQERLEQELKELENKKAENLTEMKDIIAQKNIVDQQVSLLHEQVQSVNDEIAAYAVMLADKQRELDKANENLEKMRKLHMERLRAMEENGSISYWSVLFAANSFTDLLDRLSMIEEIAAADRKRIEDMTEATRLVEETKVILQQEQAALRQQRQKLAAKQMEMSMKQEESANLLSDLISRGEEYERWMAEQEDKLSDMEDEIANLEIEYDRVKFQEWLATSVPPTTAPKPAYTTPTAPPSDDYSTTIWRSGTAMTANTVDGITWYTPCDYNRISSTFGQRYHPIDKVWKLHKGVDFAINCTPIYASRPGIVVIAGWDDSFGYYVLLDHDEGFRTVYAHMCKKPYVKAGDFVAAGQELGCVGSTGASTGNHLHFGVRLYDPTTKKYEYVNPLYYVI